MYKVTIKKIEMVKKRGNSYERLRSAYANEEKRSEEQKEEDPEFGYVKCEGEEEEETKVFEIMLDDIDVGEVAKKILEK